MKGEAIAVTESTLIGEVAKAKIEGYKFITISCVELDARRVELIYHFDRDYAMRHYRLTVGKEEKVPSITCVYLAAFLVENEIQDLFNVRFSGLAIDFDRTLYMEEEMKERVPFCRYTVENSTGVQVEIRSTGTNDDPGVTS